jgi:hypothetical protein
MPENLNSPASLAPPRLAVTWLRLTVMLLVCVSLAGSTGCMRIGIWKPREPSLSKVDPPLGPDATAEEILARVNQNAYSEYSPDGLRAYRSDSVTVRMSGVPAAMRASLVVEAPRNLRLRVAHPVTGGEAVDLGSNDEKFWVWIKESPQQNVITCSHDHVAAAAKVCPLPLPFRPDWLMEVLGVTPISGSGYEVRRTNAKSPIVELVSVQRTPDQQPIRRIVKIDTVHGVVLEHRVETLEGTKIAKAVLFRHYRDPSTRLILPRQINIDWPIDGQPLALSLEFNAIDFNTQPESVAMWTPPQMADYPELDIGLMAIHQLGPEADQLIQAGQEVQSEPEGRTTLDDEDVASEPSEFPESDAMPSNSDESQLADETLESIDRPVRTADAFRGAMPESDPLEEQPFDSTESTESEEPSSDARPFPAGFE